MNKKGIQLNEAFGAVLTLVVVGLLVIISLFMFVTMSNSMNNIPVRITNETGYLNGTGYKLSNASDCGFNNPSISSILLTSNGETITTGNYTFDTSTYIITNKTAYTNSSIKISYNYYYGSGSCTATNTMITQFGTFPALVGLVGTIIFLALVIGVLVASFAFGGKRGV